MNLEWRKSINPIPRLFEGFSPKDKPILWIRLVALARVCSAFVERGGPQVGIMPEPYDAKRMLEAAGDKHVTAKLDAYVAGLEELVTESKPASPKLVVDEKLILADQHHATESSQQLMH